MKCQYVDDSGNQCSNESTRDIRVVTARRGWRLFLCDEHIVQATQELRAMSDRIAQEEVPVDPFKHYPDSVQDTLARIQKRIEKESEQR